eukprot:scaffold64764_cov66-Phaeocystis_antarctica.AAC.5
MLCSLSLSPGKRSVHVPSHANLTAFFSSSSKSLVLLLSCREPEAEVQPHRVHAYARVRARA